MGVRPESTVLVPSSPPQREETLKPFLIEFARLTGALLAVAIVVAAVFAARSTLIGSFGDPEQAIWQAKNLSVVLHHGGDSILTDSSFGQPTPYAYSPTLLLVGSGILILEKVTGSIHFAYNVLLLGFLALNFSTMFLLLRISRLSRTSAVLGSAIVALAPTTLFHATAHAYLCATFLFTLLLVLALVAKRRPGWVIWCAIGVDVAMLFWAHEYFGLFGVIALAVIAVGGLPRLGRRRAFAYGAVCAASFAVLAAPVLVWHIQQQRFDERHSIHQARDPAEGALYSATPATYVFPSAKNPIRNLIPSSVFRQPADAERLAYLGIVNMGGLAAFCWMSRSRGRERLQRASAIIRSPRWELTVLALAAVALSFGPFVEIGGTRYRTPIFFAVEKGVPLLSDIRAWGRFGVFAFIPATVATALAFEAITTPRRRTWIVAVLVAVAALDQMPLPRMPTHRMTVPRVVQEIREAPGGTFVLHLPFSANTGPMHNGGGQFLQFFHRRGLVGSYTAFANPLFFRRVATSPLRCINWPNALRTATTADCNPDVQANFWVRNGIRFVVYEKRSFYVVPVFDAQDDRVLRELTLRVVRELERKGRLQMISDDGEYTIYRVR